MFSPYHRFRNCKSIENTIKRLRENSNVPENIYKGYEKYHFSLIHKLNSAFYYLNSIDTILQDAPVEEVWNPEKFKFKINMFLDGFLSSMGSAMDILAREVLTYFDIQLPDDVYFRQGRILLNQERDDEPIAERFTKPNWKDEFSNYRNISTHEVLLVRRFVFDVRFTGDERDMTIEIPLPDDPRQENITYINNPNMYEYCEKTFKRLLTLINVIYREINNRIKEQNSLPL